MADYVQNLQQPPYMHRTDQKGPYIAQTGDDTPGDSQKSIQRFEKEVNLWHDGTWHVRVNDGTPASIVEVAYYDPDFRVRAFKLYFGLTTLFAQIVYDTPWSGEIISAWACGVPISGQITRLHLSDANMMLGSEAQPFYISLLG